MDNERVILSKQKTLEILKEWHEAGMIMWENLPKLADEICNQWISVEDRLLKAIADLSSDMHMASNRPCDSCRVISEILGKSFGCYDRQRNPDWPKNSLSIDYPKRQPLPSAPEDK